MVRAVRCCQPYLPLSTPARLHNPPPVNLRRSSAFPAPRYLLTSAVWSIGAYGQGAWVNSQPQGDHTGQSVNMLSAFGDQLDILNVMSYGETTGHAFAALIRG